MNLSKSVSEGYNNCLDSFNLPSNVKITIAALLFTSGVVYAIEKGYEAPIGPELPPELDNSQTDDRNPEEGRDPEIMSIFPQINIGCTMQPKEDGTWDVFVRDIRGKMPDNIARQIEKVAHEKLKTFEWPYRESRIQLRYSMFIIPKGTEIKVVPISDIVISWAEKDREKLQNDHPDLNEEQIEKLVDVFLINKIGDDVLDNVLLHVKRNLEQLEKMRQKPSMSPVPPKNKKRDMKKNPNKGRPSYPRGNGRVERM